MEAIALLAVAAGAVAVLAHILFLSHYENFLPRLCASLGPGSYHKEFHPGNRIWRKRTYVYQVNYQRRQLVIRYTFQPQLKKRSARNGGPPHVSELEIQFPLIQKFWLRMLTDYRETPQEEIVLGIEALDEHFLIHSNQPEAARSFLQDDYVGRQFQILQFLFTKLEIHKGTLKLVYTDPVVHELTRLDLEVILEALMRLILFYETHSDSFRVVAVSLRGVCPYCREKLNPAFEPIAECVQCSTHVHHSCWQQNGQCTTWGCRSLVAHLLPPSS